MIEYDTIKLLRECDAGVKIVLEYSLWKIGSIGVFSLELNRKM